MRIVPVLLQPRVLAIKNRWFKSGQRGLKDGAALTVSALMMWGIYACTLSSLHDMKRLAPQATIDPAIPLAMMLVALFAMIYLSATVTALGSLFMSKDLDLTISAPLSPREFLLGKTIDVGLSVSWMICTFGFPALLAFGSFYQGGITFMIGAPLLCVGFFALATSAGMITALIVAALIPSERSKPVAILVLLAAFLGGVIFLHGFQDRPTLDTANPTALIHQAAAVALNPWLPSSHCARALTGLLQREYLIPALAAVEYIGIFSLLGFCMRLAFARLYDRGLSRTRQTRSFFRIHSRGAQRISHLLFPFSSSSTRAIMAKEYKVFSRDVTHTVQLGLLLGITFVYLYNYQLLEGPTRATTEVQAVWNIFLLLSNISLGSLVITSICSRFVFPSVSLEGNAFWLMQAAPVSLKEMLKAKFKSWLIPVSCIGGVVFISGAMALNADGPLVLASCAAGIIICHGLVGIGIGLGALFSQFEWEHSTQISTSMGSFIFMLVSMFFLSLNIIPLGVMFGTYLLFPEHMGTPDVMALVLGGGLICTYVLNKVATWWALSIGARALQPR